jgi:protein TonB
MSGKDTLHIPWAFSLNEAPSLPLIGEHHPLRRESVKWLLWANGAALVVGILAFVAWSAASHREAAAPVMREVKIVRYTELGVPPSIAKASVPQMAIAQAVAPPSIGVPEPVPDVQAPAATIATQTEMSESLTPISMDDLGGGTGDSIVVEMDISTDRSPSPEEFVAVEEEPVRLRIAPPVYPEVATQAGVEGTVLVRALVGKDGKVKDCIALDGPEMLKAAAITCAKTAVFKPALLQRKPVEVWVMIPVTFKLHQR